jgi:hypothetical protein
MQPETEVPTQCGAALLGVEQDEGREVRQLQPVVEDERGLDAAVGEEQVRTELGKSVSISGHAPLGVRTRLTM